MQQPSSDALVAAQSLRDLILASRNATETGRQLAAPIVAALVENRLGRMALPREHGGLEMAPLEQLAVLESLAQAEASVAWVVWNSSLPCWFARFLSDGARREIFDDSRALLASSTRPSGRAIKDGDAYIVNGRWSLVSGCLHAEWIPVMCLVEKDGEVEMLAPNAPHTRMLFVPREAVEIVDTWHVGGLRGTGSHDCVLTSMSVPAERSFAVGEPSRLDTPMGRMPILAAMSAGGASMCLGIATASLRALLDLAAGKLSASASDGPSLRDRGPIQSMVARVETTIEALRARVRATCDHLWGKAHSSGDRDQEAIAAVLGASVTTVLQCRASVTEIYAAAGVSSLYTESPIERAHRDIHAVAQHVALQPFWLEQAGRVRFGLPPTHPLFLL